VRAPPPKKKQFLSLLLAQAPGTLATLLEKGRGEDPVFIYLFIYFYLNISGKGQKPLTCRENQYNEHSCMIDNNNDRLTAFDPGQPG